VWPGYALSYVNVSTVMVAAGMSQHLSEEQEAGGGGNRRCDPE
jgi:hypothetical protein